MSLYNPLGHCCTCDAPCYHTRDLRNFCGAHSSSPYFTCAKTYNAGEDIKRIVKEALEEHGLIPKPKKRVTITIERWVNVFLGTNKFTHIFGQHFDTKEAADRMAEGRIACVKLTGTYEIEEE